jgi:hypothetical protein
MESASKMIFLVNAALSAARLEEKRLATFRANDSEHEAKKRNQYIYNINASTRLKAMSTISLVWHNKVRENWLLLKFLVFYQNTVSEKENVYR